MSRGSPVTAAAARHSRALGALYGLAVGDALGAPTEAMTREQIQAVYGQVTGFVAARDDVRGTARVTDDTDQALIVGHLVVEGSGHVDPHRLGEELRAWGRRMADRGASRLLGPSTQRALALLADGCPPEETGRYGTTNGAAMRIAPIGVAVPPEPLQRLVGAVVRAGLVTHDTRVAHAGAAAVAAAVSAGIEGAGLADAAVCAVRAAELAAAHGHGAPTDVADRIRRAVSARDGLPALLDTLGTGVATEESVPAAFAVAARYPDDPWAACLAATNAGGDTDTIAAMAGAMVGACTGIDALPEKAVRTVRRANDLDLEPLARELLVLRARAGS